MKDKTKTKWKKLPDIHPLLKPVTKPYKKGLVILCEDFKISIPFDNDAYVLAIKAGFIFDGASIPRFSWSTTGSPFLPEYIGPALVHDAIYRNHQDDVGKISRKSADKLFRHMLKLNGVSTYQRNKMYIALRGFGGLSW